MALVDRGQGKHADSAAAAALPVLREVAEGVHVYEQVPGGWCLNNATLVATGDRSVLIDTAATENRARRLASEVARVAPSGPDTVVNTHFHGDHVFGNALFTPRARVIAHERTRSDMAEAGYGLCRLWPDVEWGEFELALPDTTFRDGMTLRLGGLTAELIGVGPAHTASDVVVWVPERRVLLVGDILWSGVTPFVLMGSIEGSLRAIEWLRRLEPRTVVCGHGPVSGPEVLDATEGYLRWVRGVAEDGRRAGLSALHAARRAEHGAFSGLVDPERLVGNLHRAYAELDGAEPGAPIDVLTSFREMVEFHGGVPPCAA